MFFVSFTVWPQAVLLVSFFAGVLVTLQYLLFGAHQIVLGVRWVFKRIGAGFSRLLSRNTPAEVGKDSDSSKSTTTIDKSDQFMEKDEKT